MNTQVAADSRPARRPPDRALPWPAFALVARSPCPPARRRRGGIVTCSRPTVTPRTAPSAKRGACTGAPGRQLGPWSWSSRPTTRSTTSPGSSGAARRVPADRRAGGRRRVAGRHRRARRRAGHGERRVSVVHRTEKAGPGRGVPPRLRRRPRARLRRGRRDGRRRLPPARAASRPVAALAHPISSRDARWVPGRQRRQLSRWRRKALSIGGNLYARLLLGIPVHDVTAGFRLFRVRHAAGHRPRHGGVGGRLLPDRPDVAHPPGRPEGRARSRSSSSSGSGESKMDRSVATESLRRITTWGIETRRTSGARRSLEDAGPARPRT